MTKIALVAKLYRQGLSSYKIAHFMGVDSSTVRNWLRKVGVVLRRDGAQKGNIPWNKDKKDVFSRKTRQKMRQAKLGKRISPATEFKKGQIPWNKEKHPQYIQKENHWNWKGGPPKCIDCGKELKNRYAKRCRKCNYKYFVGENHPKYKGGKPRCKVCGKKLAHYDGGKSKLCRNCFYKYAYFKFYCRKPTKPEKIMQKFLNKHFPNEWKYVGDGEFWLGRRNPDFMNINGEKKLIEVFGDYWHKGEDGKERKRYFAQYGFKTLIIWEHECYKGKDYLLKKVEGG